jgi:glucose/arabinose dehydrogenase
MIRLLEFMMLQQGATRLPSHFRPSALRVVLVGAVLGCIFAPADRSRGEASQGVTKRSGYALGAARCGDGPHSFPRLQIGMRTGYCAGLVASASDGLVFPRSIVQIPDSKLFVVADMGANWSPKQGRLLLLDPGAPDGKRIKPLLTKLDLPHGLAIGIDHRVYASTVESVFRFDPLAVDPEATVETIIRGLPGLQPRLSDGTRLTRSLHPLKPFVFDKAGRIYINIGAPTDRCATKESESRACAAGEGEAPLASIWVFMPPAGGVFPALKPNDANPPSEVYARGLRNSMALAAHPQFPDEGFALLQAENARDLPDLARPNEELNVLRKGAHYGWPYCYDLATESPEYKAFLRTKTPYQKFCSSAAAYQPPYSLMPPHSAPLSMLYYRGEKFPELQGKLVVSLHGYRPTGSRVIFYDVDAKGFPHIGPAPVRYNVSCANPPTQAFRVEQGRQVSAAAFGELISQWYRVDGVRPQGAPVGMTVDSDGAIWLVEDKNQTVLRIDADPTASTDGTLACSSRTEAQFRSLLNAATRDKANLSRLSQVRAGVIERHCLGCHSDFGLKRGQNDRQKDEALLRFLLSQDGWINPGNPESGRLHLRTWGKGPEQIMPADGRELLASDPAYKKLLETLDAFVANLGERKPPNH